MPYANPEDFRTYQRERAAENMAMARYLLGGKCFNCGAEGPDLQLHHTEPGMKDFTPASGTNYGREEFLGEVAKCILLCPKCHTIGHNKYGHDSSFRKV